MNKTTQNVAARANSFDYLIRRMQATGWYKNEAGNVVHKDAAKHSTYGSWEGALADFITQVATSGSAA